MESPVFRIVRQDLAYDLSRDAVKSVLAVQQADVAGDSGTLVGCLDGQPAVIVEPMLITDTGATGQSAGSSKSKTRQKPPRWGLVIGVTGDMLLALAADQVDAFAEPLDSARRIDLSQLQQTLRFM